MKIKPNVNTKEWITIGSSHLDAVVCKIYSENSHLGDIEVVYLDAKKRAINEAVVWKNDLWNFKSSNPCGGYADKYSRLSEFVSILRRGK